MLNACEGKRSTKRGTQIRSTNDLAREAAASATRVGRKQKLPMVALALNGMVDSSS
jgi:hypothetical protein